MSEIEKYYNGEIHVDFEEDLESPYCEVCGTCGYIGCCGIRNFIEEHIEGKTNCKNEGLIINELINLCDYKDDVFKENERLQRLLEIEKRKREQFDKDNHRLHSIIKEVREYIGSKEHYDDDFDTEIEKVYKILDKEK